MSDKTRTWLGGLECLSIVRKIAPLDWLVGCAQPQSAERAGALNAKDNPSATGDGSGDADLTDRQPDYEARPEWEKALRAIVLAGEMGCPPEGLALVARKALTDSGVPYDEKPL